MPTLSINPSCNPACGVCHYKELEYPAQLARKQKWAGEKLRDWSHALREIVPAPESERLGYRAKSWMRGKLEGNSLSFGMFRAAKAESGKWGKEFISWDRCPIHTQAIQETMERLRFALAKESWVEESLHGVWIGSPHLVIVAKNDYLCELESLDWKNILIEPITHVWFHRASQVGRRVFGNAEILRVFGPPPEATHPIRAFRQVAQTLLKKARTAAANALLETSPTLIIDLYCGTGDFSLLLPKEVGWMGIELSKEAATFASTLRPETSAQHSAFIGTVEHRLRDPRVLNKIQGSVSLYLNPPRSGLSEEAREQVLCLLRKHATKRIAYLSCSASSLARDLEAFTRENYEVDLLQPYDFFPQTEHFETLAILSRRSDS